MERLLAQLWQDYQQREVQGPPANQAQGSPTKEDWGCICKRLRSLGIDSEASIPPDYVAWHGRPLRLIGYSYRPASAGIIKLLEVQESIPPAYLSWRANTTALFLLGS
jgi:hypothetical protein